MSTPILRFAGVTVGYRGTPVLTDVHLEVAAGQHTGPPRRRKPATCGWNTYISR